MHWWTGKSLGGLYGWRVIVTGGGSDIGRRTAIAFDGANAVVADI